MSNENKPSVNDMITACIEEAARDRVAEATAKAAREAAEMRAEIEVLKRMVERRSNVAKLEEEIDSLRRAVQDIREKADKATTEMTSLLEDLENDPTELVGFEDQPTTDSSIRDVMEWIDNAESSIGCSPDAAKRVRRLQETIDSLNEALFDDQLEALLVPLTSTL